MSSGNDKADPAAEFKQILGSIKRIREAINKLNKYKGNQYYKKQYHSLLSELNKTHKFLRAKVSRANKPTLSEKFAIVDNGVSKILSDSDDGEKLKVIEELERFWPELELEFENLVLAIRSFEIPEEIPMTEYRLDLEEAIKDYDNGCFISSLVMCRRAYEGALVTIYKSKTGKEPIEKISCKHCGAVIREKSYMGITKLHDWAIASSLVTDKLRQVGFLLTDMGAGAAHPPLTAFPRDRQMAELGITATLALLNQTHSKKAL